jgi:predicted RNase H-like HicB family nuclease
MLEFSVLIQAAPDVGGQWLAHCLNWDLVSQGDSPKHAIEMIVEAIVIAVEDDRAAGLDPSDRPSAKREAWDRFLSVQQSGIRIAAADIEKLPRSQRTSIAAVIYLSTIDIRAVERPMSVVRGFPHAPPPFVIAELNHDSRSARG